MSNQQPPEPPPTPRGSKNAEDGKPKGGGTNWRVIILMAIALGILMLAWQSSGYGKPKRLAYTEFRDYLDAGKIVSAQELPKRGEGFPDQRFQLKKSGESSVVFTGSIMGTNEPARTSTGIVFNETGTVTIWLPS